VRSALADIDEAIDALEARAAGDTARLVAELQDTNAPSLMIPTTRTCPPCGIARAPPGSLERSRA